MARPRNEHRRDAITAAATRVIAAHGLSAPTALIAKEAGVSNGSLFSYFDSKADLLNQLFVDLKREMGSAAFDGLPQSEPLAQLEYLWSRWVRWASEVPEKRRALAQLSVSDEINEQSRALGHQAMAGVADILERVRANGPMRDAPLALAAALMSALADTTVDFIIADPGNAEAHCATGFQAICRILC